MRNFTYWKTNKKATAYIKASKEEEERKLQEKLIKDEQERLIKESIEAERAKIWNYLDKFCNDIKTGKRLYGNNRYSQGTIKAWVSFRKLYDSFDSKHTYRWQDKMSIVNL